MKRLFSYLMSACNLLLVVPIWMVIAQLPWYGLGMGFAVGLILFPCTLAGIFGLKSTWQSNNTFWKWSLGTNLLLVVHYLVMGLLTVTKTSLALPAKVLTYYTPVAFLLVFNCAVLLWLSPKIAKRQSA